MSTTGNPSCSFVLLSDGMENSAAFWADVQAGVLATHCPVTTIAFGAATDEGLMQAIATATGGIYLYNDVYPAAALAAADVNAAMPPPTPSCRWTISTSMPKRKRKAANVCWGRKGTDLSVV